MSCFVNWLDRMPGTGVVDFYDDVVEIERLEHALQLAPHGDDHLESRCRDSKKYCFLLICIFCLFSYMLYRIFISKMSVFSKNLNSCIKIIPLGMSEANDSLIDSHETHKGFAPSSLADNF